MKIGLPKEIKTGENRVGLAPEGAAELTRNGHTVIIESSAGAASGFPDLEYAQAGAKIAENASQVWEGSEMVIKVKEPLESEFKYLREGLILFTYLHLAAEEKVAKTLLDKKAIGIAYETVELDDGSKPMLRPMSEVAGRMAVQIGMHYLERTNGGSGKLLSGVTGVNPGVVTVIGSGVAGMNAARIAHGIGAQVIVVGIIEEQLKRAASLLPGIKTLHSTAENIAAAVASSDLVIGSVAVTGASAPKLVTRQMVSRMRPGSVIVDISIDQGGCFETSRPTTHAAPVYKEEGVTHYCVTNMPGAVPNTSTTALTKATLPYALKIANEGLAALQDEYIAKGVNTFLGKLTNKQVAEALKMEYEPLQTAIPLARYRELC
ncbi:alanine dehydrogenase [Candidatus Woesearchaeota archaeon]|nr:alanine dehydrogenase [Candidatus Woesearchaeota archaeon]